MQGWDKVSHSKQVFDLICEKKWRQKVKRVTSPIKTLQAYQSVIFMQIMGLVKRPLVLVQAFVRPTAATQRPVWPNRNRASDKMCQVEQRLNLQFCDVFLYPLSVLCCVYDLVH